MDKEYCQLYHMLRSQNLRMMKARDRCPKSRIEQHKGIRILKGTWGRPEQPNPNIFIIWENICFPWVKAGIVVSKKKMSKTDF